VVIPIYNEAENIDDLVGEIDAVMRPTFERRGWEQLLVDDGSSDGSNRRIRELQARHPQLRLCVHPRNLGERAAWQTAFEQARGEIVVMLAADLQNDPRDIPRLIEGVEKGFGCCTGARVDRKDGLYFSAATLVLSAFMAIAFGLRVRDVSSSFFAVRRRFLQGLRLLENDHRYILAILSRRGASVQEIPTRHRARRRGRSHYSRWKVLKPTPEVARISARFFRGY
jgi:glycosyltransferase involved in cell wall biosynthesis